MLSPAPIPVNVELAALLARFHERTLALRDAYRRLPGGVRARTPMPGQ